MSQVHLVLLSGALFGMLLQCPSFVRAAEDVPYGTFSSDSILEKRSETKVSELNNVDVTARKVSSDVTSSTPLQTLDKADMQRFGALELSDAVKHFSGVQVKDYGGIGGLKTISVRSLGAQHTAVSYDGVAIGDCQSGQVDLSRFSLDQISKLTLSIGQSEDIYQTARMFASAAALNIETETPLLKDHSSSLQTALKVGSFGMVAPSLFYVRSLNNRLNISAYASYLRADGNYPFTMRNGIKLIDDKRNNSDIETYRSELNLFAKLSSRQDLKVKAYLFDSERGLPGSIVYDNPYAAERLTDRNYFGQLHYENRFSKKWKLKSSAKFNYSWQRDYSPQTSGITDTHFRQTESYLSATLWGNPIKGLSFSLAQDLIYNNLHNTFTSCQFPQRYTSLSVLAASYEFYRFSVSSSLLHTLVTEEVEVGTASPRRTRFSPAFSFGWKPFADSNLHLRASYKDIFRLPTFNDLYYTLVGNVNLKPEKTRQWNLGAAWSGHCGMFDYLSASLDGYFNRVDDKIIAIPTTFVWKMSNIGKVETLGADLNLSAEVPVSDNWRLFFTGTYSFCSARDVTDRDELTYDNQIAYTPKHSGTSSLSLQTPWLMLGYNVLATGERYLSSYHASDTHLKGYTDHSITLSRNFQWKTHSFRLQLDALNLGNKNYEVIRFYPMPGRNYKLTINYKF
ncbi:MAG: TonB-dependent receptor [Bacteroidaceae bacterium]